MTDNGDLYDHDFYYYSNASSPFTSADPYPVMATLTDHYPPTMATTATIYPDYFRVPSTSTSVDYNTHAKTLAGDEPSSLYYMPDASDAVRLERGKESRAVMDALLIDSSAISAGAGGGLDGRMTAGSRTPASPSTSVSSSSTEAAGQDEYSSARKAVKTGADHEVEDHPDDGKTANSKVPSSSMKLEGKATTGGGRKKGEKRQRQPRFAFMTKSTVDHLEDGYRWRKYGQKAVKSSPYPRSYYRCTTQKCTVKKRVERSHHDPSVVITTYEGQHTHPSPAALRNAAAGAALTHGHMLAAAVTPSLAPVPMPGFRRDLLMQQHQQVLQQNGRAVLSRAQDVVVSNPMQLRQQQQYHETRSTDHHYHRKQLPEFSGYQEDHTAGLLQDMVLHSSSSSFFTENLLQQSYHWNNRGSESCARPFH